MGALYPGANQRSTTTTKSLLSLASQAGGTCETGQNSFWGQPRADSLSLSLSLSISLSFTCFSIKLSPHHLLGWTNIPPRQPHM